MNFGRQIGFARRAFTLLELLVVVGIITVLIALLLPALGMARDQANRIKCLATMRSMHQAAQMHAQEHRGYMPLAGVVPLGAWPEAIGDASMKKYTYYRSARLGEPTAPFATAGLTASLAQYMGLPLPLGDKDEVQAALRSEAVYRHFSCPGEAEPGTGTTIMTSVGGRGLEERMSYMYNMRLLGMMWTDGLPSLGGNVSQVRHPEQVFLFIDGQGGRPPPGAWALFGVQMGDTLYDYWRIHGGLARGGFGYLDPERHRRRINVLYVDGHGETLMLPGYRGQSLEELADKGEIGRVGVAMGIFK